MGNGIILIEGEDVVSCESKGDKLLCKMKDGSKKEFTFNEIEKIES